MHFRESFGDGNRVAKGTITAWSCDPAVNGLSTPQDETEYILDLGGRPVTEMAKAAGGTLQWQRSYVYAGGALVGTYDPSPNPAYNASNPSGQSPVLPVLSFRLTDWQGTLRVTTDAAGVAQGVCTSLAFGDQLTCQGDIADGHHFTGKERDPETGNDYFGARYYASDSGRFLTPDWAAKPITVPYATFGDPQTLNLYAYVQNGPLNRVDADGHAGQELPVGVPSSLMDTIDCDTVATSSCVSPAVLAASLDGVDRAIYDAANRATQQQAFASSGNNAAQQEMGQDPTLPTAVAPAANWVDTVMNAIFPKTWGDIASLALAVPTEGLGELAPAAVRAAELANAMGDTAGWVTIGVTETKEGTTIVSSSEKALRPAVRALLKDGEVAVKGAGHAEVTGVDAARQMGLTPTGVAASRGICSSCADYLRAAGVATLSALKNMF